MWMMYVDVDDVCRTKTENHLKKLRCSDNLGPVLQFTDAMEHSGNAILQVSRRIRVDVEPIRIRLSSNKPDPLQDPRK